MTAHIRQSIAEDLTAIRAFDEIGRDDPQRLVEAERAIAESRAWSIVEADQVVGYLVLGEFFSRPFLSLLYLAESRRGRGLGRWALDWVRGEIAGPIFTSTNLSNARMIHLLRTSGFVDSGIVYNLDPGDPEVFFYSPGERQTGA